jgi:hypothetical protein
VTTTRRIDEIVIGAPHRRDLGDITDLAGNVAELGLLHPIVILPDGTLKRAETVVKLRVEPKAEVLVALALGASTSKRSDQESAVEGREARRWRDRLATRMGNWFHGDRGWEAARRLVWGDLENEWHELHGRRWPSWQCAGCNAPLGGSQARDLPDGNRVHFKPIDCLIRFGKRRRGAACESLVALGLSNHLALVGISYLQSSPLPPKEQAQSNSRSHEDE